MRSPEVHLPRLHAPEHHDGCSQRLVDGAAGGQRVLLQPRGHSIECAPCASARARRLVVVVFVSSLFLVVSAFWGGSSVIFAQDFLGKPQPALVSCLYVLSRQRGSGLVIDSSRATWQFLVRKIVFKLDILAQSGSSALFRL